MRKDIYTKEVLAKCKAFKACGLWSKEPKIRPAAWLDNFDYEDKEIASLLLDSFIFYNHTYTDALLLSAYHAIPNLGIDFKGKTIQKFLDGAVFTIITGENPNPTDSGHIFGRKMRQLLHVPEEQIVNVDIAIKHAKGGGTVIFMDDFIGSGDQFLETWRRKYGRQEPQSFESIYSTIDFVSIYITLIATEIGKDNINNCTSNVYLSPAHVLTEKSTLRGMDLRNISQNDIDQFLNKYSPRLTPNEHYIAKNPDFLKYGYHQIGAMLGFEHSIPDATLPIFWSPGNNNWVPLVERS